LNDGRRKGNTEKVKEKKRKEKEGIKKVSWVGTSELEE
jgi:hypothetical protein